MKSCHKVELEVPAATFMAFLRGRLPELPEDAVLDSVWKTAGLGGDEDTLKITVEHSFEDSDFDVKDDASAAAEAAERG